mmetsp:Transcript_24379/g.66513  ORF Transcript_24379/g.66513 Transcript_24379/m.66513 type:complete len:355 (+) Transcript_24379:3269-4333(+)
MRFTDAPTICTPFFLASCSRSRMARTTTGKRSAKLAASTVFMKVVLASMCSASAAFCMLALSMMLPMSVSAMALISGDVTIWLAMCSNSSSAAFLTSFRASPTASLRALVTWGIMRPSCHGQFAGSCILFSVLFSTPMVPTLTFHLPLEAAPRWAIRTGSTSSGMALPVGPAADSLVTKSVMLPPGSDFSFSSSSSMRSVGRDGSVADGFQSSARRVRRLPSRRPARLMLCPNFSTAAEAMLATSCLTSLAYLMAPGLLLSFSWASMLPSTALLTTPTTSASTSNGRGSSEFSAAFLAAAASMACFAAEGAAGAVPLGAFLMPIVASSSSLSRASRRAALSSSSLSLTIIRAPR